LTQETFLRALKGVHTYNETASPKTWLIRIARNVAIDYARKHRYDKGNTTDDNLVNVPSCGPTPDEIIESKDVTRVLLDILNQLSPSYRDVLILRGLYEFSTQETAGILGWSSPKVRVTYHRALKAAQRLLGSSIEGGIVKCHTMK
jgi:RNA polymerase sigma-70 factor (ECF subfamily)